VPPRVTVVLPCLNEAGSVAACVREALDAMEAAGLPGEVVVVDNGSTDGSQALAAGAGARVVAERRRGYGSALQAGIVAAEGEVVVMADADQTYPLDQLPRLVRPVLAGDADLVLGSRMGEAGHAGMPFLHRFLGTPVLSFLISRAAGRRIVGDSQSGFRAFRRDRMLELGVTSTGMEFASEMLIRAARAAWRIDEVPTGYRVRVGESKLSTFSDGWRHLQLILLLAPELLLVGPGAALVAIGALLSVIGFLRPSGLIVGSLRWQPVFFSSICLVLGTQALLAGMVAAYRSSVATRATRQRFAVVGRPGFPNGCFALGGVVLLVGLALDAWLFFRWLGGGATPPTGSLEIAALAQSLLMVGGTLASFGIVIRFVLRRSEQEREEREERLPAAVGS
jgi:glycosyltransferase involved in cell wall biosynthesis